MKPINVLIDFGSSGRHHSLYDEILEAPPEGVRYLVPRMPVARLPRPAMQIYHGIRSALKGRLDVAGLARGINRAAAEKCDVVHFANHIGPCGSPFVVDFEHALSLLHGETDAGRLAEDIRRVRAERTRLMESPACKFLLPWTMQAAKSLWIAFPSKKIVEKTRVVPLAMRVPKEHKPLPHDGFRVLFLGTSNLAGEWNFYYRGGRRMLRVFEKFARGRRDVELVMTGEVPPSERKYAERIGRCRVAGLLSKEKLEEALRTADVLFYPSYGTPGLAFLEAMRHHLPIVTTDAWANVEIVRDGKEGIVVPFRKLETRGEFNLPPLKERFISFEKNEVDAELEKGLLGALERLHASGALRRRMGEAGFRKVSEGRFSITARNKRLRQAYGESAGR